MFALDCLVPVKDAVIAHCQLLGSNNIGAKIKIHSSLEGFPDLSDIKIAIIGATEQRNDIDFIGNNYDINGIRKSFYQLFKGNWMHGIADLGDFKLGKNTSDTYYAMKTVMFEMVTSGIIPILIGGSQDLTFAMYRAYDEIKSMLNIVNIDARFDLSDDAKPINNRNYMGKIITEKPFNLFNYTVLGYQTYLNPQEEIDLMDKLFFESYRLGTLIQNIEFAEPMLRDADIVTIDLDAIKASELGSRQQQSPNGFDSREICALSRYAGISSKVSSFGIFQYRSFEEDEVTSELIAQIIWYFIEGVNYRLEEKPSVHHPNFQKFTVLIDDQELVFFKSLDSRRWWIEIPFLTLQDNKLKQHSLLPCTQRDYDDAGMGIIPERWYKVCRRNSL